MKHRAVVIVASAVVLSAAILIAVQTPPGSAPTLVVETSKGTFSIETFPQEAPITVAHIVDLARKGFYDGQHVHRAVSGFVVQFGDPRSRDESRRDEWGKGPEASSGRPIGVVEISKKRRHGSGAVGVAHMGDPSKADSQIYVTLAEASYLDGYYTVFGQVIDGVDVPGLLDVGDRIVKVSLMP